MMSIVVIGNVLKSSSSEDPGSAYGFGYEWWQTDTGLVYARNPSNTAWVFVGNAGLANLGNLPRSGGAMTGAITGAHGLMPTSGGNFTTAPTILGNEVATKLYVDEQDADTLSQISVQVAQALASQPVLSVNNKVAFSQGISGDMTEGSTTFTIPLPTYADGSTATAADVANRYGCYWVNGTTDGTTSIVITEVTPGSRTFQIICPGTTVRTGYHIGYFICAIRS